jgi:hypothetical protein
MQADSSGRQLYHFSAYVGLKPRLLTFVAQQPWQIPLIRSFMSASSALIGSTYFGFSDAEAGAGRAVGLAAAGETAGGFARS